MGFVVLGDEVFNNGARFPKGNTGVRVMNGGGAEELLVHERLYSKVQLKGMRR